MNDSVGGNPGSTSLRSPEPVPVSAHAGNDPGRKWTPGPWKIFRASNGAMLGIGVDRPADEDHAAGVTDAYGGLWGSGGEKEANARLIAAAPELYDALEHILDGALSLPRFAEEEGRAALAKAKGGE
jgi:hypothetical protein